MRWGPVLLFAVVSGAVACSLFTDLDVSGGATSPPTEDGSPVDGSSSGTSSGSSGSSSSSSGSSPDSGLDGSPPCLIDNTQFCDTFEQGSLQDRWTEVRFAGGGSIGVDNASALSLPNSLVAEIPAGDGGTRVATLIREIPGSHSQISCTFSLRGDVMPTMRLTPILIRTGFTGTGVNDYSLQLRIRTDRTELVETFEQSDGGEGSTGNDLDAFSHFNASTFRTVRIAIKFNATGPTTYEVFFDGNKRYEGMGPAVPVSTMTTIRLFVGIVSTLDSTSPGAKLRYDDVRCTF